MRATLIPLDCPSPGGAPSEWNATVAMMDIVSEMIGLACRRLDEFIREAYTDDPEAIGEVYVATLWKNSASYVDYLDLHFSWNIERAWREHARRPANRHLISNAKWETENWEWYEDCPHSKHKAFCLFDGEAGAPGFELDRALQESFLELNPVERRQQHLYFVKVVGTAVASVYRGHPITTKAGIAKVPLLFEVPGCPNYGEEFRDIWLSWNPDGLPPEVLNPTSPQCAPLDEAVADKQKTGENPTHIQPSLAVRAHHGVTVEILTGSSSLIPLMQALLDLIPGMSLATAKALAEKERFTLLECVYTQEADEIAASFSSLGAEVRIIPNHHD